MKGKNDKARKIIEDIEYPKKYAEYDKKIQQLIFPEEPLRKYSFNRSLSACVTEEIYFSESNIKDEFDRIINENYKEMLKSGEFKDSPSLFLIVITSDIICSAAIKAIEKFKVWGR